jgi:hypothetical protein
MFLSNLDFYQRLLRSEDVNGRWVKSGSGKAPESTMNAGFEIVFRGFE